ncbi:MBL fold metallo-hydrolase [candidate division KSB1 bacterium]|nr:MBL fold metallo-hydrolase [candidate division KSB1 bacterium]
MNDKINVYFFNVGDGESILIEFISETTEYVIIDSNLTSINGEKINPVYNFLQGKKVTSISTLVITHLHQDHYNGIEKILKTFDIKKIVIPPFLSRKSKQYNKILDQYKKKIRELLNRTDDSDIGQYANSLANLLNYISNNDNKVEEVSGRETILRFPDVKKFTAMVYLPLKKITGVLHKLFEQDDFDLNHYPQMNDSSIAFCLNCFDHRLLLTGDSTKTQWSEHQRSMLRDGINCLFIDILKVPHHGSKHNNTERMYKYFFNKNKKYAICSANGTTLPDKEYFSLIKNNKIIPFCTNLSHFCKAQNEIDYSLFSTTEKMRPFLQHYIEKKPIPCQGDITLSISKNDFQIKNSTNIRCIYRDIEKNTN